MGLSSAISPSIFHNIYYATLASTEPHLVERQLASRDRVGRRLPDPARAVLFVETRGERIGQDRQPAGAAPTRRGDRVRQQRSAEPGTDVPRLDEQLVQI